MSKVFQKVLNLLVGDESQANLMRVPKNHSAPKLTERDLLRRESKIGAELFGPIPKGHRREFFCLDESTWIWHEEWKDEKGVERQSTTRYEVHPNGILKVTDGPRYQFIDGDELDNLVAATRLYYEQAARQIYGRDPQTGTTLAA